jgi:hypothetical protein
MRQLGSAVAVMKPIGKKFDKNTNMVRFDIIATAPQRAYSSEHQESSPSEAVKLSCQLAGAPKNAPGPENDVGARYLMANKPGATAVWVLSPKRAHVHVRGVAIQSPTCGTIRKKPR